jgi:predicted RNase H-like HicB family nuclease
VRTFVFRVVIDEDPFEDGRMAYAAYVPELKSFGAASWGYSREEAVKNLQEATELVIGSMVARGEDFPEGVKPSEEPLVAVSV